jgi:hypothetical protein
MSLFSFFKRRKPPPIDLRIEPHSFPTVEFDQRLITKAVKDDIANTIAMIDDIPEPLKSGLYKAALQSAPQRDLASLDRFILSLRLNAMTKRRAADISRFISNRTSAFINKERCLSLGTEFAVWMYSGAPCDGDLDALHREANGSRFPLARGMLIDGQYTWPGREAGCKCVSKSVIPGF